MTIATVKPDEDCPLDIAELIIEGIALPAMDRRTAEIYAERINRAHGKNGVGLPPGRAWA